MPSAIQLDPAFLAAGCWLWTGSTWVRASGDGTGRLNVNIGSSTINVPVNIAASAINVPVAVQSVPANQTVRPPTGVGHVVRAIASAQIAYSPGRVFWLSIGHWADGAYSWRLKNGATDAAADFWWIASSIHFVQHFVFWPPIEFSTAIRLTTDSTASWWSCGFE